MTISDPCICAACQPDYRPMRACGTCGCKRCPGAADHRNTCTGSNEPGQPGSLYADPPNDQEPDMTKHDRHDELVALLTEIRDRLPERTEVKFAPFDPDLVARNLAAIKHEAETPMREHGECCGPAEVTEEQKGAPSLAEWYRTLAGPTIHEGQPVTVAFKGIYRGYDPMLGHHHIEGRWEGVEHLPAYVERLHWAASIEPLTASTATASEDDPDTVTLPREVVFDLLHEWEADPGVQVHFRVGEVSGIVRAALGWGDSDE